MLKEEGYIQDYEVIPEHPQPILRVTLKYVGDRRRRRSVISALERVSKPGRRVCVDKKNIPWVLQGMGIAILTTSKGSDDWSAGTPPGCRWRSPLPNLLTEVGMSRPGNLPIELPRCEVEINGRNVQVKGAKGTLSQAFHPDMTIEQKMVCCLCRGLPNPSSTRHCTA